ncbi:alpha/beta hydrolase [bacterium]|nr:MAG: alpha/beta hydrolase [bacterium]
MKKLYPILVLTLMSVSFCAKKPLNTDPIPTHKIITIESSYLQETRTITVWTPPEYETEGLTLPVMYMPDGGLKEDFPHIANTMASLIEKNQIPPMILVGIENTFRRRDLTGPTEIEKDKEIAPVVGGSENFRKFIQFELIPEINKTYRTSDLRGILGESAAGLFIMETFFLSPELFKYYIAFDPALWWNNHYLVRTAQEHLSTFPKKPITLWFAGSSATDISPYTNELAHTLDSLQVPLLRWNYSDEPNEKHSTIFRATKEKAIIWALNPSN